MATKNISLTEEAYRRLRSLGRENESFSEIVIRITHAKRPSLSEFFGVLSKESGEELEKAIEVNRRRHLISRRARIARIVKELN